MEAQRIVVQQASRSPGTTDHYNVSSSIAKCVSSLHTAATQHPMHTATTQHPTCTAATQHQVYLLESHCCIALSVATTPAPFILTSYV